MQTIHISKFLRATLLVDAVTCVAMGLLMTLFSARLSSLMALPAPLLIYAGLSLFPFSGFFLYVATRGKSAAFLVWAIVLGNALWTLGSILILLAGWVTPNISGLFFVLFQAVGVAALAGLELIGLKRPEAEDGAAFQH
jgi:O-antigen/teichoic acid export membrane protein